MGAPLRQSIVHDPVVNLIIKKLERVDALEHQAAMLWNIVGDKFGIVGCEFCELAYFEPFSAKGIVFQGKAICSDCLENPHLGEDFDQETLGKFFETLGRWFARCSDARSNHWFVEPEVQDRIKKYLR